ncbi:MAG: glycosyltransferase family 4 protein [Sedimentisphaerales bacterium]|nr:glycosyltransferase family 4 protein [Sedimentisphaerales bacterium]
MKITFILNGIGVSGGTKAVFQLANKLQQRGHKVEVIYPLVPLCSTKDGYNAKAVVNMVRGTIGNLLRGNKVDWFELHARVVRVPWLAERYIPDADVIVATWWETAYLVSRYNISKGEKFYFAQHYEVWGGPKKKVDESYKLGLRIIVNSGWLKNILEGELGVRTEALILHSPDWDSFYPESKAKRPNGDIRILLPYRRETWKGFADGIEVFEKVKKQCPNATLVTFGSKQKNGIPSYAEHHNKPSNSTLRKIYNSCDIFLFPSWEEGFGMPPMEAMACKVSVVTTNVGAVCEYTIPGETAMVSEPKDIEGLAENIIRLIENKGSRDQIAEKGYDYIRQFSWANAADKLEKTFQKYVRD